MSAVKRWLLMEIGCLECGDATEVLGTFDTSAEALDAGGPGAQMASEMDDSPLGDWRGSGLRVIFDLEQA